MPMMMMDSGYWLAFGSIAGGVVCFMVENHDQTTTSVIGASASHKQKIAFLSNQDFELASATCQNAGNQEPPLRSSRSDVSSPLETPEATTMSSG
jgi:hypothetical protein